MQKLKKYKKEVIVLVCLILLSMAVLGRTLYPSKNEIIYGGDLLSQFYFWKGYLKESLLSGRFPFWNPYSFSGTPFMAHPAIAPFYPATILYLLLPLNIAFSVNYLVHLIIGGGGIYYLTRRYAPSFSSLIAASFFITGGYVSSRIYAGHVDLLTTAVWLPWVTASFLKLADHPRQRRNFIRAVVFTVLLILAGYSAYLVFALEFIFFLTIYLFVKNPSGLLKTFISFALVIFISLGLSSPQWLPTWQLTRNSIRGQGLPYELASWGSLPISGLKLFLDPLNRTELNKISFNLGGGPQPNPFDHFPGRLPLLIIFGFIFYQILSRKIPFKKKQESMSSDFWFFGLSCLIFLWLAFGTFANPSLHHFLYNIVPFYRYIRIPIQNLIISIILIPVMAGMVLSKIRSVYIKTVIGVLVFIELFSFSHRYIFLTPLPENRYDLTLINELNKNLEGNRLLPAFRVISPILRSFDLNASLKYHWLSTSGYDPVILKNYYDFIDITNGNSNSSLVSYNVEVPPISLFPETLKFLSVSQLLLDYPSSKVNDFTEDLKTDGFTLLKTSDPWPLFFSVYQDKIFNNERQLKKYLLLNRNTLTSQVNLIQKGLTNLLSFNLSCSIDNPKSLVIIKSFQPEKIVLETTTDCTSFLASSQIWYPGWQAKIDGESSPVLVSNLAFRTIFLPKGRHIIEYYYYPKIYIWSAILSCITLIVLLRLSFKYYE